MYLKFRLSGEAHILFSTICDKFHWYCFFQKSFLASFKLNSVAMKKLIMMMLLAVMAFTTTTTFAQTKKDGTKDMRYKANKTVTKKDGTPDLRYKANKTVSKTSTKKTVAKTTVKP